jgi:hypothetical protein
VIGFRPDLHDHPMLHQGMSGVHRFLRDPNVRGIAPLSEWIEPRCLFAYPSRDGVLLSTIVEQLQQRGRVGGPRAALELLVTGGPLLDEAARAGRRHGLPSHGALHPWRILVHPLGGLTLVGYGLPAVEVNAWLDEETRVEPGAALTYFPPERIGEQDEDARADQYALAMAALELLLGRPAIEGAADERLEAIVEGAGAAAARQLGSPALVELFSRALAPTPTDRFPSGRALADRAQPLLRGFGGVSLFELAAAAGQDGAADRDGDGDGDGDGSLDEVTVVVEPSGRSGAALSEPATIDEVRPSALAARSPSTSTDEVTVVGLSSVSDRRPAAPRATGGAPPTAGAEDEPDSDELPAHTDDRTDVIGVPLELIQAMSASDTHAAPPPIPDPGPDPSLAAIQALARRVVDRCSDVAARALSLAARVQERAAPEPAQASLARSARAGADKARRSADAARNSANLLALDEDASGALITLDLVRNAEMQCESALAEVQAQHRELERFAERLQAQARALQDAARRATEHAQRATDAANQADDLVTALERERAEGSLSAPGTDEALELALASAERAHASAEEARAQAEQSSRADRADLALRYAEQARRAEEAAIDALRETREAADRGRRHEGQRREVAARRAVDAAARARTASEDAWRALQRAEEALRLGPSAESRRSRDECAGLVRDAEAAAAEADRAAGAARAADKVAEVERFAAQIEAAAAKADQAASRAGAASDRIVRAAGALAEARARLSKLQEEGRALADRSRAAADRLRAEATALLDALAQLPTESLAAERRDLDAERERVVEAADTVDARLAELTAGTEAGPVETSLSALRRAAAICQQRAADADVLVAQVRPRIEEELREHERREEARREVARSASQAREAARRCRELVDQAAALALTVPAPLPGCRELDEVARLRSRAAEIVDIAEFQAGEASASADAAAQEPDPAEARGHAQTASSFLDRIGADVPEAVALLEEAARLARRENDTISGARDRAAECEEVVGQLERDARAAVTAATAEVGEWRTHRAVAPALDAADDLLRGFGEDLDEAHWAREHLARATSSADAQEFAPRAEGALARARERRRRVDATIDAIRRGVSAAEAAFAAVADARRSARTALEGCGTDLAMIGAAQQRLKEALERFGAGRADIESVNAELGLRELTAKVRSLRQEIQAIADQAEVATEPEVARTLAAQALERKVESEIALERAAEIEARGIAAAEQSSRARAEAEHRRLLGARDAAREHARRAREAVEGIDAALDEAEGEGAKTPSSEARVRFEEAEQLGEALRTQIGEVERLAEEARNAEGSEAAQQLAERAGRLFASVGSDAARVMTVIQEALDLSRAAEAEANALRSVRDEVRAMVSAADEAVERAQADASQLRSLSARSPRAELRAMVEQTASALQTAASGAAKVRAALPLAEQASSLPIAEATLRAARQALDRAVGAAGIVRQHATRAADLLQREEEAQAASLADARGRAAQPAQEAVAAASKATAWAETGRREWEDAGGPPSLAGLVKVLERTVADVRQRAGSAQDAAKRAATASSEEEAARLGRDVRQAADLTGEAARHARASLDELREQIRVLRAEGSAVLALTKEAADHAAAASQVAEQAEATLRELEAAVESLGAPSEAVEGALLTVRTCTTNARFAAATAASLADATRAARRRADAEQAVEEGQRALEDAIDALERVVAAESACRAAIEAQGLRRRQEAERAERDRRRREEEASRARAEDDRRRQQAEEDERRRREDERRSRMERRREERRLATGPLPPPTPPAGRPALSAAPPAPTPPPRSASTPAPAAASTPAPAADREALRSMLRQTRPSGSVSEPSLRPRRRGDGRRDLPDLSRGTNDRDTDLRPPDLGPAFRDDLVDHEPTETRTHSGRHVKSWTPASATAPRPPADATAPRPRPDVTAARPRPRPEPPPSSPRPAGLRAPVQEDLVPPPGASGDRVDALLERLRSRRSDRD